MHFMHLILFYASFSNIFISILAAILILKIYTFASQISNLRQMVIDFENFSLDILSDHFGIFMCVKDLWVDVNFAWIKSAISAISVIREILQP